LGSKTGYWMGNFLQFHRILEFLNF
jgi:hypothetical protein